MGGDHYSTLNSMTILADAYENLAFWLEAEELGLYVLEMHQKISGEDHPDTIDSMAALASFSLKEGRMQNLATPKVSDKENRYLQKKKRVLSHL